MKEKYKTDKIKVYRKCGIKWDYHYKFICPTCNKIRICKNPKCIDKLCKSCAGKISHKNLSKETRQKMSDSKKGKDTWNKGKINVYSEETKGKWVNII